MKKKLWKKAQRVHVCKDDHWSFKFPTNNIHLGWCFYIYRGWKESDFMHEKDSLVQRGLCSKAMGVRNVWCNLTPFHAEFELWSTRAIKCMTAYQWKDVVCIIDYSDLVKMMPIHSFWII